MKTSARHQSSVTRFADPPPTPIVDLLSKEDSDKLLELRRNVFRPELFGLDADFLTKRPNKNAGRFNITLKSTGNANVFKLEVVTPPLTPIVNDPYVQGKIFIATLLSPLYALGVTEPIDELSLRLHISPEMNANVKKKHLIKFVQNGFEDALVDAHVNIFTSNSEILKPRSSSALPMLTISGSLSTYIDSQLSIFQNSVETGDILVLTKAVGTHVALKAFEWLGDPKNRKRVMMVVSELEVRKAYQYALESLSRSNRTAAQLMWKYGAHGAVFVGTDGLERSANKLVRSQKTELTLTIYHVPMIGIVSKLVETFPQEFNLKKEINRECGGMLIAMSRKSASKFLPELRGIEGQEVWVIGEFRSGSRGVDLIDQVNVIEV